MTAVSNLLKDLHPEIAKQYAGPPELLKTLTYGSNQSVFWKCEKCLQTYPRSVKIQVRGAKCPVCLGFRVVKGYNDVATTHPHLLEEWDFKNSNISPYEVTYGSSKEVAWVCKTCKNLWKTELRNRTSKGAGCPECARQGFFGTHPHRDLVFSFPSELEKFLDEPVENVLKASYRASWRCLEGHEFKRTVTEMKKSQTCPICSNKQVLKGYNDVATTHPEIVRDWSDENVLKPTEITYGHDKSIIWECKKGHRRSVRFSGRIQSNGCPQCNNYHSPSKPELELQKFVKKVLPNTEVKTNVRGIVAGELDILIPEKRLAIEFNGLYWHREGAVGRDYHFQKFLEAEDKGIQLLYIWEDDWRGKRKLVEGMLRHRLGVSEEQIVGARKLSVERVDYSIAKTFLDEFHIQGATPSTYYYAGLYNGSVVALMTFLDYSNGLLLNRFATSCRVPGGFSKILKTAERELEPPLIYTFSDNGVSDGGLYKSTGFKKDGEIAPDYSYIVGGRREHKFGYRKNRFKTDPKLRWEDGLTERELAELNGLERVWDAGKVRWVLEVE